MYEIDLAGWAKNCHSVDCSAMHSSFAGPSALNPRTSRCRGDGWLASPLARTRSSKVPSAEGELSTASGWISRGTVRARREHGNLWMSESSPSSGASGGSGTGGVGGAAPWLARGLKALVRGGRAETVTQLPSLSAVMEAVDARSADDKIVAEEGRMKLQGVMDAELPTHPQVSVVPDQFSYHQRREFLLTCNGCSNQTRWALMVRD